MIWLPQTTEFNEDAVDFIHCIVSPSIDSASLVDAIEKQINELEDLLVIRR